MATPDTDAPLLDARSAADILARAQDLAENVYLKGLWKGARDPADPAFQLLTIFGRLMEILFERLNRVPDKNFLAFLDMVGVEASPGHPSSLPLTFLVAAKAESGGYIPAGTQVATTQTETADAQVFETRDAFFATPARLLAAVNLLPAVDRYSVVPLLASPPKLLDLTAGPATATLGDAAPGTVDLPHTLFLGSAALFGRKEAVDVTLFLTAAADDTTAFNGANLRWQRYSSDLKTWVDVAVTYPPAPAKQVIVKLAAFSGNAKATVAGREDFWLACQFDAAFPAGVTMPSLVSVAGTLAPAGALPSATAPADRAFQSSLALDLSRPFSPFGERPRYGDAFYVQSDRAFAAEVEQVTVDAGVKVYTQAQLEKIFATIKSTTTVTSVIVWQYAAAGGAWKQLCEFRYALTVNPGTPPTFSHEVKRDGVTTTSEDGAFFGDPSTSRAIFSFTRQADMSPVKVFGQEGLWIRALIRSDDPYGRDGFIASPSPLAVVDPTWIAPVVETLDLSFTYRSPLDPTPVPWVVTENNLGRVDHSPAGIVGYPFQPFIPTGEQSAGGIVAAFSGGSGLYLGFDRPFGEVYVSLYLRLEETFPSVDTPAEGGRPLVAWEYLSTTGQWRPLDVEDATGQLTRSGTVSFGGPHDAAVARLFDAVAGGPGQELCWLRARLVSGLFQYPPAVRGIFLNTVMADNVRSFRGALTLGSGSGEKSQSVLLPKAPVLGGSLWVREPEVPSSVELTELEAQLEKDAELLMDPGAAAPPSAVELAVGTEREAWVRWRRVPNFLGSGPRDRHYTLNPLDGEIRLGDGVQGLLAPVARDNLGFRDLQTGGGELANRVATPLAVKELKSSLPYVDKVFNVEPAVGGSNPWDLAEIFEFGPQSLKNKGRAVSAEDYEWMVVQRFSEVARARCLSTAAPGPSGLIFKPGAVTVIVVPKSNERVPRPSTALLEAIREYLAANILGAIVAEAHVLGPSFTEVAVKASLRALDPRERSEVKRRATQALEAFFHPLSGGEDGRGWAFGRDVQISEIHAVLQRVTGVDYVDSVDLIGFPGATSLTIFENCLVASGTHDLEMI